MRTNLRFSQVGFFRPFWYGLLVLITVPAVAYSQAESDTKFIRSVGEAAKVLTDEQRKVLIGTLPPEHNAKPTR